jgi:hypothetical protein
MMPVFQEKELIWLEVKNLRLPYGTLKLLPRHYGPFQIEKTINPVVFKLRLPTHWNIHPVFHASLLTPYQSIEMYGPTTSRPSPEIIDGEPEYEVESILNHKGKGATWKYLVKWKGYDLSDATWEPEDNIHAPLLVKAYFSQNNRQGKEIKAQTIKWEETQPLHQSPLSSLSPLSSCSSSPTICLPALLPPSPYVKAAAVALVVQSVDTVKTD